MVMKNEGYWEDIENLVAFREETPNNEKLWYWLEEFQKATNRTINSRSLILLKALLDHMYSVGHAKGVADAEYNDTGKD